MSRAQAATQQVVLAVGGLRPAPAPPPDQLPERGHDPPGRPLAELATASILGEQEGR
ncbi:MAG: hypothetical protein U0800_22760 [Isosphaeraceae bacterium]